MKLRLLCASIVILISQASSAEMRMELDPFQHFPHIANKIKVVKKICTLATPEDQQQLLEVMAREENFVVLRAASECLSRNGTPDVLPALMDLLTQPERAISFWPLSPSFFLNKSTEAQTVHQMIQTAGQIIIGKGPISPELEVTLRKKYEQNPSVEFAKVLSAMNSQVAQVMERAQQDVSGAMAVMILKQIISSGSYDSMNVNDQGEATYTQKQRDGSEIICWVSTQEPVEKTRCVEFAGSQLALTEAPTHTSQ